ncbi:hypothetical protein A2853_03565 [Candidatus Kaiserbacteria bacterium RIFCSPHIGHO2_01_FULL_55_17]|uniref:Uncharacterized protein n=1 Tax=Candidatus Kaiserbacteria bacterium RIFCSPHIGHO2_01_FULL_55_17 TaxID=1798484 RepID=A0A1F6D9C1_9BACT|nr:MAG: hypothetical protein A2853_03565 [Candidatus Kaiserbacteria bacterium RIFCSPHIGHO2_01_FULL_55_17]
MGSSPCSHDNDITVGPDASTGVKGSDIPVKELDKSDPTLWRGHAPGPGNPYAGSTNDRKDVIERFDEIDDPNQ